MKKVSFITLFITVCVMLGAQTGEEMLRRAIGTNPTNSWGATSQKGQWTDGGNLGACLFSTGSMHLGSFWGNKKHGYGITIAPEGQYINNCPHAKYYVGTWSNDEKSGTGTCYNASGKLIYYGEFKDDKPTGAYPTADSYSSTFQTINHDNDDKYIGETSNGKSHGYGVYVWKNGRIWIGSWKGGVRSGQGIEIAMNGRVITGYWENNTFSTEPTLASTPED